MLSAMRGPISGICCSSSWDAFCRASIEGKCSAKIFPALLPTWRIPRAKASGSEVVVCYSQWPSANSLPIDLQNAPDRSNPRISGNKDRQHRIRPAASSCSTTFGPNPSISIASREAKWIIPPDLGRTGQPRYSGGRPLSNRTAGSRTRGS